MLLDGADQIMIKKRSCKTCFPEIQKGNTKAIQGGSSEEQTIVGEQCFFSIFSRIGKQKDREWRDNKAGFDTNVVPSLLFILCI